MRRTRDKRCIVLRQDREFAGESEDLGHMGLDW